MAAKRRSGTPTPSNAGRVRELRTFTLAPESIQWLDAQSLATGEPRGAIIDRLIRKEKDRR